MITPQQALKAKINGIWQGFQDKFQETKAMLPSLNLTDPTGPILDFTDSSLMDPMYGGDTPQYKQLEDTYDKLSLDMKNLFNAMTTQSEQQFKNYTAYLDSMNAKELAAQRELLAEERAYQTEMSNTAWQRQFADMKAAGLNPYAAAMGGGTYAASTPQVGAGSTSFKSASYQDHLGAAIDNIVKGIDSYYNSAYRSSLADSTARGSAMNIASGIMKVLAFL